MGMERITARQIRALWGCAGRLHLAEEELRGWIYARTGKRSIRELTLGEASALLDELLGKRAKAASETPLGDRMTPAQSRWISALEKGIGWDERRTLGLARRMYHIDRLEALDRSQASGLIEALKSIGKRSASAKAA
jgi:hypothetical protein